LENINWQKRAEGASIFLNSTKGRRALRKQIDKAKIFTAELERQRENSNRKLKDVVNV